MAKKAPAKKPPAKTVKKVTKVTKAKPAKAKPAKKAPRAELQKVAFTMFGIENAERARGFYEGVLGLQRGLSAPNGQWTEYDLPGGGCLALFMHPNPAYKRAPGGASIAFEVSDLDALNKRLKAAGVPYQGDMIHGPRCRMSNILDTEGNAIILHELHS